MTKTNYLQPTKKQVLFENILKWLTFAVAVIHICVSIMKYPFPAVANEVLIVEKWGTVSVIALCFSYFIYSAFFCSAWFRRIREFIKGLMNPEMVWLCLFFVWFLICTKSTDARYASSFFAYNENFLYNVFFDLVVLFPFIYYFGHRDTKISAVELLTHILIAILTISMIWVIWNMFIPRVIYLPGGGQIGFDMGYRLCINCNPNTTGAYAEILFLLSVIMILKKRGIVRALYCIAAVVHYLILSFSNSRACVLGAAAACAVIGFKVVFDSMQNGTKTKRLTVSAFTAVIVALIVLYLRELVFIFHNAVSHFAEIAGISLEDGNAARDISGDLTGSGRVHIWICALKAIFASARNFFVGVTPAGVVNELVKFGSKPNLYTHNQFLEVAVAMGIPGLVLYVGWLYCIARKSVQIAGDRITLPGYRGYLLPTVLLMLIVSNMFEAILIYYGFLCESVFFIVAGYIAYAAWRRS